MRFLGCSHARARCATFNSFYGRLLGQHRVRQTVRYVPIPASCGGLYVNRWRFTVLHWKRIASVTSLLCSNIADCMQVSGGRGGRIVPPRRKHWVQPMRGPTYVIVTAANLKPSEMTVVKLAYNFVSQFNQYTIQDSVLRRVWTGNRRRYIKRDFNGIIIIGDESRHIEFYRRRNQRES